MQVEVRVRGGAFSVTPLDLGLQPDGVVDGHHDPEAVESQPVTFDKTSRHNRRQHRNGPLRIRYSVKHVHEELSADVDPGDPGDLFLADFGVRAIDEGQDLIGTTASKGGSDERSEAGWVR